MGMFIGASMVTLAEISVFLLKCCWGWFSKKRRGEVVRKVNSIASSMNTVTSSSMAKSSEEMPVGRKIQFWMESNEDLRVSSSPTERKSKVFLG